MAYDALRQGLFVTSENKVKMYGIDFGTCFGQQIQQFCNNCGGGNDPNDCLGCFTNRGFESNINSCIYSREPGETFAPRLDMAVTCCAAPLVWNTATNSCSTCAKGFWKDNSGACQPNPQYCEKANDLTGICLQAAVGYYVNHLGLVANCWMSIPGCLACESFGEVPTCTLCHSSTELTAEDPISCDCPGMEWFNVGRAPGCQLGIENCVKKAHLFGCDACKGNGVLTGDIIKQCSEPVCGENSYFGDDWVCKQKIDPLKFTPIQSFKAADLESN